MAKPNEAEKQESADEWSQKVPNLSLISKWIL